MNKSLFYSLFLIAILVTLSSCASISPVNEWSAERVEIQSGLLEGRIEDDIRVFRGVPYAASPLGERRWKQPEQTVPWKEVRKAVDFGPSCPAPMGTNDALFGANWAVIFDAMDPNTNEDCLTLNVWSPLRANKLPVMVYLSPFGHGSDPYRTGETFAKDDVVFVSVNHRSFTMGAFAHPLLTKEVAANVKPYGRFLLLDLLAALHWIQNNIEAFGGDPKNVTLFGFSNGGAYILQLMTLDESEGLFHKAIIQSGQSRLPFLSPEGMENIGIELARIAGIEENISLEELRVFPPDKFPFFAAHNIDKRVAMMSPVEAALSGQLLDIPIIIGGNSWDGSSLRYVTPESIVDNASEEMLEAYEQKGRDKKEVGFEIYTDQHVLEPARWYAANMSKGAPSYLYHFSYIPSYAQGQQGASHGQELPFIFNSWSKVDGLSISDEDKLMTDLMHGCWVAFAKTSTPSCPGAPAWPAYDPKEDKLLEIKVEPKITQFFRKKLLDLHEREKEQAPLIWDGKEIIDALQLR